MILLWPFGCIPLDLNELLPIWMNKTKIYFIGQGGLDQCNDSQPGVLGILEVHGDQGRFIEY